MKRSETKRNEKENHRNDIVDLSQMRHVAFIQRKYSMPNGDGGGHGVIDIRFFFNRIHKVKFFKFGIVFKLIGAH